ncbi:MAG: radical SAM protein [Fusobacteriaceae bacterium]
MENRYSRIKVGKFREIVLLKGFPCKYGKCSFCNYIEDNSLDEELLESTNFRILENITGEFGVLEVINSGSVFELPLSTLEKIREVVKNKKIKTLIFEIYYGYINRINEIKVFFPEVEVLFKMGIETFDNEFRKKVYNKNFTLIEKDWKELREKLYSVCLLVCTKGQSKEMIERDIKLGLKYFSHITINIFVDNGTVVKNDPELERWIIEKYEYLSKDSKVDFLITNKDFGVFEQ